MDRHELERMVHIIPSPSYFFDLATHRILAANPLFESMMGYSHPELLEMTLEELRPASDLEKLRRALAQAPPEGVVEWKYCNRAGQLLYVLLSYRNNVLVDEAGEAHNVRLVVINRWGFEPVRSADELFGPRAPSA